MVKAHGLYKGCIQVKCNFLKRMIKIQIVRRVSQKEILALNCTCQKKIRIST